MGLFTTVNTEPTGPNAAGLPSLLIPGSLYTFAFDDFNRADSATLGSTSVGAKPWTATPGSSSTPRITNNRMINDQSTMRRAIIDAGEANYRLTATIGLFAATVAGQELGIMARCTNFDSYVYLCTRINTSTQGLVLLKLVGSTFTTLGSAPGVIPVVGDVLSLDVQGNDFKVYRNGNTTPVITATESVLTTGKPGLLIGGSGTTNTSGWDDFKIEKYAA
jgi:hypothetical protein